MSDYHYYNKIPENIHSKDGEVDFDPVSEVWYMAVGCVVPGLQ